MDFKVFPNPARDQVMVRLRGCESANVEVAIIDNNGATCLKAQCSREDEHEDLRFNVGALPRGSYLVQVRGDDGVVSARRMLLH